MWVKYFLCMLSGSFLILASSIRDSVNSFDYEMPFFILAIITGLLAILCHYRNYIRRFTYPAIICVWAWSYKHNLLKSKFSSHTYRVYVFFGNSYKKLYRVVQTAFDKYLEELAEV